MNSMDFYVRFLWILLLGLGVHSTTTEYFNTVCNVTRQLDTSRRLEAATTITYKAHTACYYHLVTDASKLVFLYLRKFDLEHTVNNVCVDFVNIHDGGDTTSATLNTSPLCGDKRKKEFYTSTGNQMTVYFQSDATGQSLGFEMLFSAITTGTCSSSQTACLNTSVCIDASLRCNTADEWRQYRCTCSSSQTTCLNTSVCIDSSLRCNTADECGDNTDEDGCVYPGPTGVELLPAYVIIICGVVGGILFITFCVVIGHLIWKHNKWRWLMHRPIKADRVELQPTTYESAYPVTKVYYKEKYQSMYHDTNLRTGQGSDTCSYHTDNIANTILSANSQSVV